MKNIFLRTVLLLLTVTFLSSCSTHYIATWQNHDEEREFADNRVYVIKKDTIGISHSFNTASGNVKVRMENYTDKPILINLTKSAMTINGKTQGFGNEKSTITGRLDSFGVTSFFNGEIKGGSSTLIIPPYSFVEGEYTDIRSEKYMTMGTDFDGNWTNYPLFDVPMHMKVRFFDQEQSPIQLTSYINYSILDRNNQPVSTDILTQSFYLSSYSKLRELSSRELQAKMSSHTDMSSFTEVKGGGGFLLLFLGGLTGAALLIGPEE